MARGNRIVVSSEPLGKWYEGIVKAGQTFSPGMCVQMDNTVALQGGAETFKYCDMASTGDPVGGAVYLVVENYLIGKTVNDTYAAGERVFLYRPAPGDQVNILLKNLAGTADDHPLGETVAIDDNTGKFVVTATAQNIVAVVKEAVTDPVADTLTWAEWRGN